MKVYIFISLLVVTIRMYSQDCNCNSFANDVIMGTNVGEGKLTTNSADNELFNFFHPRWRGGWKWTTNSSQGTTNIMQLKSLYDKGTSIDLSLGSGTGSISLTSNIVDNGVFDFYIPRWRGGWKWTTASSNGKVTAMQLHNKNNGGDIELRLDGNLITKEVEVKLNVWADYVFNTSYNLLPLKKVEEYINSNGHLPNIPSEEDVLKNGILLGEMNTKLLEKIEELTLYLIDQQKQIDDLKKEIKTSK
ncbi:hypothetical protein [Aquimarina intermedia]|uniref:Uncharacterized protein n=1 Tax=Aquimarina intermedia TaxID=350814 RepID=A0A5S5CED0_9FLAO|nr:hypothetical protein [Aquimarina intermedia]TYP76862.1 hypothetical protein BD809_1017 [Aquimarina intermedia]